MENTLTQPGDTLQPIEFRLGERTHLVMGMLNNLFTSFSNLGEKISRRVDNCRDLSQRLDPPHAKHGVYVVSIM